jgi:hypothetical protein
MILRIVIIALVILSGCSGMPPASGSSGGSACAGGPGTYACQVEMYSKAGT